MVKAATDGLAGLTWWQWTLLVAFPSLVWVYFRYFSRLSCRDECQPPTEH